MKSPTMMQKEPDNTLNALAGEKVLVMLSGGKDSALCLKTLKDAKAKVESIHFRHKWCWGLAESEATRIANSFDSPITIVDYTDEFKRRTIGFRDGRPCKICKPGMYKLTIDHAKAHGFRYICVGDNASDTIVDRIRVSAPDQETLYITSYLDCISEGVLVPEDIKILRPLIHTSAAEVEEWVRISGIEIKRVHETGDKYLEYWREGCPIQYNEPGEPITEARLDELYEYNVIATTYARDNGFRASVQMPSRKVITIPRGHEREIEEALKDRHLSVAENKTENRQTPGAVQYIIEVFQLSEKILTEHASIKPFLDRLIERLKLDVVKEIHYDLISQGSTSAYILSTSHLAVRTWPEHNYLHINLLSSKDLKDKNNLHNVIFEVFKTYEFNIRKIKC